MTTGVRGFVVPVGGNVGDLIDDLNAVHNMAKGGVAGRPDEEHPGATMTKNWLPAEFGCHGAGHADSTAGLRGSGRSGGTPLSAGTRR